MDIKKPLAVIDGMGKMLKDAAEFQAKVAAVKADVAVSWSGLSERGQVQMYDELCKTFLKAVVTSLRRKA